MTLKPAGLFAAAISAHLRHLAWPLALLAGLNGNLGAAESKPTYENNFQQAKPGPLPDTEFLILDGAFEIKQDGDQKFIELPGAPLDTFGVLFGPTQVDGVIASARMHGTKQGRRFPTFAIGLNGAGGYRLQVSPAKRQVELLKGDEIVGSAAFEWESNTWTEVRLQVRKVKEGAWRIEGKAWTQGKPEPAVWQVTADETTTAPAAGRASIWGAPFATTPIRFDDLRVAPAVVP
jgi:hypothetical protein